MKSDDFKEIKDIEIKKFNQSELDELKGLSIDEIFKLFSGYNLPTTENDEIKVAKKLKTQRFRLKICISIITKNKIIANYVKFLEFFNAKYLQDTILANEGVEVSYSTIWSFLQNMVKAGFLFQRKITFKSAHKINLYKKGIRYFWVKNCPEAAMIQMYEHLEEDKFLYSKEMKKLELEILKQKNKNNKKSPKEIVNHNLEVKKETIYADIQLSEGLKQIEKYRKKTEKLKLKLTQQEKEKLRLEKELKIKNGEICYSGVSKAKLIKLKKEFEKELSNKFHNQVSKIDNPKPMKGVNWFKRHFEHCNMKLENHS